MKKAMTVCILALCMLFLTGGCGQNKETAFTEYVQSTLDASYKGQLDAYCRNTGSEKQQAEEIYQNMVSYGSACLRYYTYIIDDYLTDEERQSFDEIAEELLSQSRYEVEKAQKQEDGTYLVKVTIYPTAFWEQIRSEMEEEMSTYNSQIEEVSSDETKVQELEKNYTDHILDICRKYASAPSFADPVEVSVTITLADGVGTVEQDTWDQMDDLILNVEYILNYYGDTEE